MWVFTIHKMLRVYFLHHRELLGELSRAAYETVRELMAAAVFEDESFRPGMVSVVQTCGEAARFHPHVHALCSRGGWSAKRQYSIPTPTRSLQYSYPAKPKFKALTAPTNSYG